MNERAPIIYPGARAGVRIPQARASRLFVDTSGAVRVSGPGGSQRTLAAPGTVRRVVFHTADQFDPRRFTTGAIFGLIEFQGAGGPLAVLNLAELLLVESAAQECDLIAASGVGAVADALGLVVEPATEDEARLARQWRNTILVPEFTHLAQPTWLVPVIVAALLVAVCALPLSTGEFGPWAVLVAGLLLLAATWQCHARRRHLMSALRQPLSADGRTEFTIDPAKATTVGLSGVRLQVGDEDVVLQAFGSERWIPGPGRHGAVACVWESGYLVLRDPRDRALLTVAGLFEDQAAQIGAAFTACGGSYSSRPLLTDLGVSLSPESSVNLGRGDTGDPTSLSVGLMDTATVILTLGAAIAAAAHPWATPLLLVPLGIVALRVQGGLRLRSWRRHQSRPAGA